MGGILALEHEANMANLAGTRPQVHNFVVALEKTKAEKCSLCFEMAINWLEVGGFFLPEDFPAPIEKKVIAGLKALKDARAFLGAAGE